VKSGPALALLLWCTATVARADLEVENAWVRGLPPGVANTAAFMTLRNTGSVELVLTGAESPLAASVSLHGTMNHDGVLHMMEVTSLAIPAGGVLRLESGGTHLMLEGIGATLVPGTEVALTLLFSGGAQQTLLLPVRSVLDE
jgi:periplasmic copper chaperone A